MVTKDPSKTATWLMFNRIAKRYDRVNRIMSFYLDVGWRRCMASFLPSGDGLQGLDLATGTADVAMTFCKESSQVASVLGLDMSENMLEMGRHKVAESPYSNQITLRQGNACEINSESEHYDWVSIAFGIRNVDNLMGALGEMHRVLKPKGRVIILESSLPQNPIVRWGHLFYLRWVMPVLGWVLSGDYQAYKYLNQSIETFPYGSEFCDLMSASGFKNVTVKPLFFGVSSIYVGEK